MALLIYKGQAASGLVTPARLSGLWQFQLRITANRLVYASVSSSNTASQVARNGVNDALL